MKRDLPSYFGGLSTPKIGYIEFCANFEVFTAMLTNIRVLLDFKRVHVQDRLTNQ